jgi:hypothetical protein
MRRVGALIANGQLTRSVHEEDTMTEQQRVEPDWDDVQGHGLRSADAEAVEGDHTEGHGRGRWADAETAEGDDVEGHMQVPERDELNHHQRLR